MLVGGAAAAWPLAARAQLATMPVIGYLSARTLESEVSLLAAFRLGLGAAGYVDRILRGANPADLPINASSQFDFIVNLRAARALGLAFPPDFVSAANEVIE